METMMDKKIKELKAKAQSLPKDAGTYKFMAQLGYSQLKANKPVYFGVIGGASAFILSSAGLFASIGIGAAIGFGYNVYTKKGEK